MASRPLVLTTWLFASSLPAACTDEPASPDGSTSSDPETHNSDDSTGLRGDCELGTRVGGFRALLGENDTSISGEVADGVIPASVPKLVGETEACQLLRADNPFCDPPCQFGETCDFDGSCIPEPAPQSVGVVEVSGFARPVKMELPEGGFLYFDTSLPHPGFEPGAKMELTASGADQPGFTLYGEGVAPLVVTSEAPVLRRGQDLMVTWEAGSSVTSVRLLLNIDQHGNSPISLVCEGDDAGQATLPAELLTELLDAGASGFPSLRVVRRTIDHIDLPLDPGCVSFEVSSTVQQIPSIEGHIPCKTDDDCPDGQVCDETIETCVEE